MPCPFSKLAQPSGLCTLVTLGTISLHEVDITNERFLTTSACMLVPHALYYNIFKNGEQIQNTLGEKAAPLVTFLTFLLFGLQIFGWSLWYTDLPTDEPKLYSAGALVAIGLLLNLITILKTGPYAVCYGSKLGCDVPSNESFPLSVVAHPVHIGSLLLFSGIALLNSDLYWKEVTCLLLIQLTAYVARVEMERNDKAPQSPKASSKKAISMKKITKEEEEEPQSEEEKDEKSLSSSKQPAVMKKNLGRSTTPGKKKK